jgi:stage II sporulation protein D
MSCFASRVVIVWVALAAMSCAPVPPPGSPSAPPATSGGSEAAAPRRIEGEPQIEIGIRWALDSLTVIPSAGVPVTTASSGGEQRLGEPSVPIRVRLSQGACAVGWNQEEHHVERGDTLWIGREVKAGADGVRFRWLGQTWRGRFKVFSNARGKLTVVIRLPLETYLLGVVPGEIGGLEAETIEAGRAQAIAARSYTLFYLGRRGSEGFDLYSTVEDQVYGSVESERDLPTHCVTSTRGEVALSNGRPIRANYCSTCGGVTAEVWEAWPADPLPYLVSHRDSDGRNDYCSESVQYRWREEWTPTEFLSDVTRFGPLEGLRLPPGALGDLVDVRIPARSRSGRAARLEIETTTGAVMIPAGMIRRVIRRAGTPALLLRSNLFKIGVRRDPATRKALAVVASGGGSGHGVGLCQTGAVAMARQKVSADRILTHYYPGIQLKRLY